tara:strand:- start:110 stop:559 length:450 start_codon:yes stop_codon:yes gene_type:complete
MSKIKSFRGQLADGSQDTVVLHTNNGSTGYMIKKLALLNANAGDVDYSAVVKIYSVKQATVDNDINFSDQTLLAVGYISTDASSTQFPDDVIVIFDNTTFNQDIYVTCKQTSASGNDDCNYYIELEQIKLDLSQNTVATLKDIRNITGQ